MAKLRKCIIGRKTSTKDKLIRLISSQGGFNDDRLLDFMDTYGLVSLREATVRQLREYLAQGGNDKQNGEKDAHSAVLGL